MARIDYDEDEDDLDDGGPRAPDWRRRLLTWALAAVGLGLGFLSLHAMTSEVRSGALRVAMIEGTPVMRTWNIVHLVAKVLSPAAEAFRYFVLEHAEAMLSQQDEELLGRV